MQTLWQDMRYGVRMLLKNPGFALIAVLTLALGIGANTAIFSVVNAVLLRPLPYPEPERLVAVYERDVRKPVGRGSLAYPNFYDFRAQSPAFEHMAAYYTNNFALTETATPINLHGAVVTPSLFPVLGVQPQLGRWLVPEEEKPGVRSVVLSHAFWQRQFGGDPNLIGRALTLDGKSFNVVGVMPAGFQFPIEAEPVELWVASSIDAEKSDPKEEAQNEQRGAHFLFAIGRLKPDATIPQAQAELSTIAARLREQYPESNKNTDGQVLPFHDELIHDYRSALWIILGAVGCVLLIACANVANLLLARATARYREMALRAALGANRWRVVRQLLTESLLLALSGGLLGLLLAWWGTEALVRLIPSDVPRLTEITLDRWVFGFTLLMSLVTGVVFGLAPAMQASKIELTEAMKEGARGTSGGRGRLRNALVVAEIALALVLLIGAGLLLQTFRKLQQVDLGYDTSHVLTAAVELPDARYPKQAQAAAFYQNLVARLRALPGVESASAIVPLPLSGNNFTISFAIAGRDFPKGEDPVANFRAISPDYFNTMKIPLKVGRAFADSDNANAANVVIVNESFVQKFFPDQNPLGKRIKPGISIEGGPQWREIVGVVKDVKHRQSLSRAYEPEYYLPHAQMPLGSLSLVLRTTNDPRALVRAVEAQVHALDREIPLHRVKTLEQYLGTAVAQPKFNALLLGLFAALALVLTAIGLYGVMAYSVLQRTQEIGIRLALGAQPSDVLRLILRHGLLLTVLGLGLGLGTAFALTRLMQSLLFGVRATDPLIFAGVALLLATVALLACWIPARRATQVDPLIALRCE